MSVVVGLCGRTGSYADDLNMTYSQIIRQPFSVIFIQGRRQTMDAPYDGVTHDDLQPSKPQDALRLQWRLT